MKIISGTVSKIKNKHFDVHANIVIKEHFWSKRRTKTVYRSIEAMYSGDSIAYHIWYDGETSEELNACFCLTLDAFVSKLVKEKQIKEAKEALEEAKSQHREKWLDKNIGE